MSEQSEDIGNRIERARGFWRQWYRLVRDVDRDEGAAAAGRAGAKALVMALLAKLWLEGLKRVEGVNVR